MNELLEILKELHYEKINQKLPALSGADGTFLFLHPHRGAYSRDPHS